MSALAIDVGSSSVRTGVVDEEGRVRHVHQAALRVSTPSPGHVELDGVEIAELAMTLASRTLRAAGGCDAVGVTNQRATTLVFDPSTSAPVGPVVSWQDLRTVFDCLELQSRGIRLAPNQSATKARWLVARAERAAAALRFATIETWIAWQLTRGDAHVSDRSNAALTGLVALDVSTWDPTLVAALDLDEAMMPALVDTIGVIGAASALPGSPPITALIGDQPASLFGQACVRHGAKITFGTGAMLDMVRGDGAPASLSRFASGCFPVVLRSEGGAITWGLEGIVLSAGSCVEWLVDLGVLDVVADSEQMAGSVSSSDGVSFVPAFAGIGTPRWDFGARGGFFGLTRATTAAHLVRAVLEGVAHRGADLLDAAEIESGLTLDEIRVDGGMSANRFFLQALADATGRRVAVSREREATTRGAGLMALVGAGAMRLEDVERLWSPFDQFEPRLSDHARAAERARWHESLERAARTVPELSAVSF